MAAEAEVPYQALYRRFRPQRFSDVLGQGHVTRALQAAVRDGKVAHAYLFSGPRGTGKTSTARILAMALNCEQPQDGEPCGQCGSCVAIRTGVSLDVQELDSATNRGIDEMRDLLSRVALGTPGRWKVYIVDEVHQITAAAASALLKTLEEPPGHVIFVLATTDPQKVLDTIRSRTQHFEFRLLGSDVLASLLTDVAHRADIDLSPEAIDVVVRRGHGSARDALSALDQVAAAGTVEDDSSLVSELVDSIVERDAGAVLVKVAEASSSGLDPRRLATELLEHLRNGFLATRARSLVLLSEDATAAVEQQAAKLGAGALVRAMELIGQTLIDMRDSADPRTTLEVALVRLAAADADDSRAALLERIERLERAVAGGSPLVVSPPAGASISAAPPTVAPSLAPAGGSAPAAPPTVAPSPSPAGPSSPAAAPAPAAPSSPPSDPGRAVAPTAPAGPPRIERPGRPAGPPPSGGGAAPLGAAPPLPGRPGGPARPAQGGGSSPEPAQAPPPGPHPASPAGSASTMPRVVPDPPGTAGPPGGAAPSGAAAAAPSREELTMAWGDRILPSLRPAVKVYVATGRFLPSAEGAAVYAVPDRGLLTRAEANRAEVEAALAKHFGRQVKLRLVLDSDAAPPAASRADAPGPPPASEPAGEPPDDDAAYDWADMEEAPAAVSSPEQRLLEAFPGAEEVQP
ncbi:MAG TPA: DNA polymerase III subunit gamma/tau [Acidimicrobiales bacterium]|nr:DNA polymerase III subunit gamma/tau [Acidimicrobiales bacterium]